MEVDRRFKDTSGEAPNGWAAISQTQGCVLQCLVLAYKSTVPCYSFFRFAGSFGRAYKCKSKNCGFKFHLILNLYFSNRKTLANYEYHTISQQDIKSQQPLLIVLEKNFWKCQKFNFTIIHFEELMIKMSKSIKRCSVFIHLNFLQYNIYYAFIINI